MGHDPAFLLSDLRELTKAATDRDLRSSEGRCGFASEFRNTPTPRARSVPDDDRALGLDRQSKATLSSLQDSASLSPRSRRRLVCNAHLEPQVCIRSAS